MEEFILKQKIESLQIQMVQMALEKGSLLDRSVIEISQQLDHLIVRLQHMLFNAHR